MDHLQTCGTRVTLQRIERVGDAMTMLALRRRHGRIVRNQSHANGDLPRRRIRVWANQKQAARFR
jgi:hypothetical protein